jgi:hypothetical protein
VAAELPPHRRQEPVRVQRLAAGAEALVERGRAESTGTGTPSSIAARIVQRPSPESDTRPPNPSRSGDAASAAAVRSRSHDATTEPRRQTSAISATSKS